MANVFATADVKAAALLTSTEYDGALGGWIATLERQITDFTGLTLAPSTGTVRLDGRWHPTAFLPRRPVSAVTLVRIWDGGDYSPTGEPGAVNFMGQNTAFTGTPPTPLTLGVDYGVRWDVVWNGRQYAVGGRLLRNGRPWPGAYERRRGRLGVRKVNGQGNIEVQYAYGFADPADIPPVFLTAVAAGVQAYILRIPTGGLITTSNSLDGASTGSQVADGGAAGGGLHFPELASVKDALSAYIAPRVF